MECEWTWFRQAERISELSLEKAGPTMANHGHPRARVPKWAGAEVEESPEGTLSHQHRGAWGPEIRWSRGNQKYTLATLPGSLLLLHVTPGRVSKPQVSSSFGELGRLERGRGKETSGQTRASSRGHRREKLQPVVQ